jgi:hypothetical protein
MAKGIIMTDLETIKNMLIKSNITFEEQYTKINEKGFLTGGRSAVPQFDGVVLIVYGGYMGFYSMLSFTADGALYDVEAFE